jgi:hypothetical protein
MTDLQMLIDRYKKNVAQFEAQIEEIKRKLTIATEASRLLEEEGLGAALTGMTEHSSCCNLSGMDEPLMRSRG